MKFFFLFIFSGAKNIPRSELKKEAKMSNSSKKSLFSFFLPISHHRHFIPWGRLNEVAQVFFPA